MPDRDALVVIPTYLREPQDLAVTMTAIESVFKTQKSGVQVLCVDDGSPSEALVDGLEAETQAVEGRTFELIRKEENTGFSRTVNVGLKRALEEGRDAVLLNADMEIQTSNWLKKFRDTTDPNGNPAGIVGALLLFPNGTIQHAGVYFCQPPGSTVLTAKDGEVPIEELNPGGQGVVTYSRQENRIFRARDSRGRYRSGSWAGGVGYPFEVGSRPYSGRMLEIDTGSGRVQVTPNHKFTAFWSERARGQYAVYVMCRGGDWRIGHTQVGQSNGGRAFGPRLRMNQQGAEAVWVLSFHPTKEDALYQENLLAWEYGVPTLQFRVSGGGLPQPRIDDLWARLETTKAALALLLDFGRDPDTPLYSASRPAGRRLQPFGPSRRFEVAAANLMPEFMRLPVDEGGQHPGLREFTVDSQHYQGEVFSLNVKPHHHYISGGVVVKNSALTRTFDHMYKYGPGNLPEAVNGKRACPVTGAFQFIRHEVLEDVGLYDENFSMGWEDVDHCIRTFLAGHFCIYNPNIRGIHYESMFRGRPSEKVRNWQAQSWAYLMLKYANLSFAGLVPFQE